MSAQLTITFEALVELADQLTPAEQEALRAHLEARRAQAGRPSLDLLMFDVGPWPENQTLRREDEYGDEGR